MCKVFNYIYSFFTEIWSAIFSPAVIEAAIGSAFGAFGGAYCLWAISKKAEHEKNLSDINYVLAILIAHMNSLLNFKKQHALPFCQEMEKIITILENPQAYAKQNIVDIQAHQIFISVVESDYNTKSLLEKFGSTCWH